MTGTHRRSGSVDKSSALALAVPYHCTRAGSIVRDRTKTSPNPLTEMSITAMNTNTPSPLKRSDALPNLLLGLDSSGSPSVTRVKRLHKVRKQASVDNFTGPGHRDSPFGTPHATMNPSVHAMHDPQHRQARAPHPLSRGSITSSCAASDNPASTDSPMPTMEKLKLNANNDENRFNTPDAYKSARPLATAFMSTGLLSKRNQPLEHLKFGKPTPDTPCKRPSLVLPHSPGTPGTPGTPLQRKEFFPGSASKSKLQQDDSVLDENLFIENEGDSSLLYASSSSEFDGTPHTPTRSLFPPSTGFTTTDRQDRTPMLYGRSPADEQGNYFLHTMAEIPLSASSLYTSRSSTPNNKSYLKALSSIPRTNQEHFSSSQMTLKPECRAVPSDLRKRFNGAERLGSGEFSDVYLVEDSQSHKFAVKRSRAVYSTAKTRARVHEEASILEQIGKHEHIIGYYGCWEDQGHLYIQTEYCENGSLDVFLRDLGRTQRLDEFRAWKVLTELALGLCFIHEQGFLHLDLKPANFFITFEGVLKIGDFGLSVHEPAPPQLEREGDIKYIAPEVIQGSQYGKPADVFSVGITILEVAGNIVLPHNGVSWHKLRSGDLSDVPKLSSSDESALPHSVHEQIPPHRYIGQGGLDRIVEWMCKEDPTSRPTIQDILNVEEVMWVNRVRRAGAVIYEGDRGPETSGDYDIYMVNEEPQLDSDGEDWRMEM